MKVTCPPQQSGWMEETEGRYVPSCWDRDKPLAPPVTGHYWALGSWANERFGKFLPFFVKSSILVRAAEIRAFPECAEPALFFGS